MTHTGLVYKVDSTKIYTIEGNTGAGSNVVIANGGEYSRSGISAILRLSAALEGRNGNSSQTQRRA